jgi:predicted RNA methylase
MRVNPSQVAAATGFQVWEGARALKKMLEDPEMPLSAHIKGKRVLELGSGTGLAGLCASAIGGDVMLSGVPPASALVSACTPLRHHDARAKRTTLTRVGG